MTIKNKLVENSNRKFSRTADALLFYIDHMLFWILYSIKNDVIGLEMKSKHFKFDENICTRIVGNRNVGN